MYRKLASYFEATHSLRDYDFFGQQKLQTLQLSTGVMEEVARNTKNSENNVQTFARLLKVNIIIPNNLEKSIGNYSQRKSCRKFL